jgi:anti-sigma factor RsiW
MECRDVDRLADLSLDGETDGSEQADIVGHLTVCPSCRQKHEGRSWFHGRLRAKLRESSDDLVAPPALRSQIATQLRVHDRHVLPGLRLSRTVPATLALGTIVILSWSVSNAPELDPEEPVAHHSRNLPPEVRARDGEKLQQLFKRNLRYPVRVPRLAQPSDNGAATVQLVGGRLSNIQNRDAAYIMYDDRGARISLFAYPNEGGRVSVPKDFQERRIGNRNVMVGKHRGYNVVAWESGDVLYSLVSEVDPTELMQLASTIE